MELTISQLLRTALAWTVGVLATFGYTILGLAVFWLPGVRLIEHRLARAWARTCVWGSGCRVVVEGFEELDSKGRYVVMVNHQSALDIPLLMAVFPARWRTVFWAKESLFRIPVLGWAMRMLGHMPIDRINRRTAVPMLAETVARLRSGRSALVFPEETYSPDGELLPFQRGGFVLAARSGLPILPVGIHGTRQALPPRGRLVRPGTLTVRFGVPLPAAARSPAARAELMEQVQREILRLSSTASPTR